MGEETINISFTDHFRETVSKARICHLFHYANIGCYIPTECDIRWTLLQLGQLKINFALFTWNFSLTMNYYKWLQIFFLFITLVWKYESSYIGIMVFPILTWCECNEDKTAWNYSQPERAG